VDSFSPSRISVAVYYVFPLDHHNKTLPCDKNTHTTSFPIHTQEQDNIIKEHHTAEFKFYELTRTSNVLFQKLQHML